MLILIGCNRDGPINRIELPDGSTIDIPERFCTEEVPDTPISDQETVDCGFGARITVPIGKNLNTRGRTHKKLFVNYEL